jgi:nitrogen regulatory protein PII-like uncharacterized protein
MKNLGTLIGIVVLAGVGFFIYKNYRPTTPAQSVKTFTYSTGAFSFSYPSNLVVQEKDLGAALFSTATATKALATFSAIYYPDLIAQYTKANMHIAHKMLNGRDGVVVSELYGTVYIVALDTGEHPSYYFGGGSSGNSELGLTTAQMDVIFGSLNIDMDKIKTLAGIATKNLKQKSGDAEVRVYLSQLRAMAESYFNTPQSYATFCASKDAKDVIKAITDVVGVNNFVCRARKDAYAFSAKLPTGTVACVDSVGHSTTRSTLPTGYLCE